jgi:hypothetical protein
VQADAPGVAGLGGDPGNRAAVELTVVVRRTAQMPACRSMSLQNAPSAFPTRTPVVASTVSSSVSSANQAAASSRSSTWRGVGALTRSARPISGSRAIAATFTES